MMHEVQMGTRTRMSFSKINEVLEMPHLIELQKTSYQRFLDVDLYEVLADVSPITDYSENLILEFIDYSLDQSNTKYSIEECKERDVSYSAPLKVRVRLINKETGEVKEQDVFMGDFPVMTPSGTFIINGAERVIVSQLVRSPGAYFSMAIDKTGKPLYSATVIPGRGAWLEYEQDSNDILWVRVDRTRKLPLTVLLRAMGYGTDAQIVDLMGETEYLHATLAKDSAKSEDDGLVEIYKRLRPGEPPSPDSARSLLRALFFDPKRYDLAKVGRYKFNKKLALPGRITGHVSTHDIIDPRTGELYVSAGEVISREAADKIQAAAINAATITVEGVDIKVLSNNFADPAAVMPFDPAKAGLTGKVHMPTMLEILGEHSTEEDIIEAVRASMDRLVPKSITVDDMVATVNYYIGLNYGVGVTDDIDHLGNRRVRSVGELLQNQIRIGLSRLERVVKERMAIQDPDVVTPQALINIRPPFVKEISQWKNCSIRLISRSRKITYFPFSG